MYHFLISSGFQTGKQRIGIAATLFSKKFTDSLSYFRWFKATYNVFPLPKFSSMNLIFKMVAKRFGLFLFHHLTMPLTEFNCENIDDI